jgi:hypothetical protein
VAYSTVKDRTTGAHQHVSARQRLILPAAEGVMLEWMEQGSASGTTFDHRTVRNCASELGNRRAGKNWSYRFIKRNPQVVIAKPAKLDPKRANNFNEAVVTDFYDKFQHINDEVWRYSTRAHL